jgi:hypothetical protein
MSEQTACKVVKLDDLKKLLKIWILKNSITNTERLFSCRVDAEGYENSHTTIHEGYFITKEQLAELYQSGVNQGVAYGMIDMEVMPLDEILKQLGEEA